MYLHGSVCGLRIRIRLTQKGRIGVTQKDRIRIHNIAFNTFEVYDSTKVDLKTLTSAGQ